MRHVRANAEPKPTERAAGPIWRRTTEPSSTSGQSTTVAKSAHVTQRASIDRITFSNAGAAGHTIHRHQSCCRPPDGSDHLPDGFCVGPSPSPISWITFPFPFPIRPGGSTNRSEPANILRWPFAHPEPVGSGRPRAIQTIEAHEGEAPSHDGPWSREWTAVPILVQ